jgi:hypothetical protein
MQLQVREPGFSRTTAALGYAIAYQLIRSIRRSRRELDLLFEDRAAEIDEIAQLARSQKTISYPLVRSFILQWASNISWPRSRSSLTDAIEITVPSVFTKRLRATAGIESFSLFLSDLGEFCSASLGSNSYDRSFGFILNCPAWIKLVARSEHQQSFEKQIVEVVQHEMAHFRYSEKGYRSEMLAHCRGVAAMLSFDNVVDVDTLREVMTDHYPELSSNPEINELLRAGNSAVHRLVRLWLNIFRQTPGHNLRREDEHLCINDAQAPACWSLNRETAAGTSKKRSR